MFPAAQSILKQQKGEQGPSPDWLTNPSYQQQEPSTSSRDSHVINEPSSTSSDSSDDISSPYHKKSRSHHRRSSDDEYRQKKKSKEKKQKHKSHRKHKKSSGLTNKTTSSEPKKPNTIWISETNLDPKDAYRIDSKSDPSNLNYDTLYSNDQASYKRYYGNLCLGLRRGQHIKFTDKRNRSKKHQRDSNSPVRYYETEIEPTESTQLTFDYQRDLHDIQYFRSQLGDELGEAEDEMEQEEIEQNRKPLLDPLPSVLLLETEATSISATSYLQKKVEKFNKLFQTSEGDNVELWIEYINFQDELYQWSSLPSDSGWSTRDLKKKYRRTIAEKKMAIYEKAMKRFPYSIKLIIGYMETVEDVWDSERILAKWKDIVFYHANQSILWVKYIEACMSCFSVFQTNNIIALFAKAIDTLASIVEGKLLSHRPEVDSEKKLLAVFVFYCYFLRLSGYTERAIASFQSLIEFNSFYSYDLHPTGCYYPRIGRRKGLRSFWESDAPRFGEDDAMGWRRSVPNDKGEMPTPEVIGLYEPQDFDKLLCLEGWKKTKEEKDRDREREKIKKEREEKKRREEEGDYDDDSEENETEKKNSEEETNKEGKKEEEWKEKEEEKEEYKKEEEEDDDDIDLKLVANFALHEAWTNIEVHREMEHCLPGRLAGPLRSKMNFDDEDPEHITLFEDIVDIQFIIEDSNLRHLLHSEFLRFIGAPIPGTSVLQSMFPELENIVSFSRDVTLLPFCLFYNFRMEGMNFTSYYYQPSAFGYEYQSEEEISAIREISAYFFTEDVFLLQYGLPEYNLPNKLSRNMKHFISTVFNHVLCIVGIERERNTATVVACSWLLFELLYIKQMKADNMDVSLHVQQLHTLAMNILEKYTVRYYSFFWDFAYELEALMETESSCEFTLEMFAPFKDCSYTFDGMFSMALSYVEYHLDVKPRLNFYSSEEHNPNHKLALSALLSLRHFEFDPINLPKDKTIEAKDIVKTEEFFVIQNQKFINQLRKRMISIKSDWFFIHFSKIACHLYFAYLTNGYSEGGHFMTLCGKYRTDISQLASDPSLPNHTCLVPLVEGILVLQARILATNTWSNTISPKILTKFLIDKCLQEFPSHSWFLMLLARAENRYIYRSRLQSYFYSLISSTKKQPLSAAQFLCAIRGIFNRFTEYLGDEMNSVEQGEINDVDVLHRMLSMLEKGSEFRACRLCPAFWRLYMRFWIKIGKLNEAKRIFHQSIYYCPGAKVLYTDAIWYFPEDVEKILEIAEEKLIRIRVPLDVIRILQEEAIEKGVVASSELTENKDSTDQTTKEDNGKIILDDKNI